MLTIESQILLSALASVQTLAPSKAVAFLAIEGSLWLFSKSPEGNAAHLLPSSKMDDFFVVIDPEGLKSAVQGRDKVTLSLIDEVLNIRSDKFKADLSLIEGLTTEYSLPTLRDGARIKLSAEEAAWLTSSVNAVVVTPSLPTGIPLGIKITPKGTFVACYDPYKASYTKSKILKGEDTTFTLPLPTIQAILSVFGKSSFNLRASESHIYASNSAVRFLAALPQVNKETEVDLAAVVERTRDTLTGEVITLNKNDLTRFVGSLRAIRSSEALSVGMDVEGSKVVLSVQTSKGKIREVLKNATPCSIKAAFNLVYFEDSIKKCKESLKISIKENVALLETDQSKMLVSLDD